MKEGFAEKRSLHALPPLTIRADATLELGTGHIMRCACVADAWRDLTGQHSRFVGRIEQTFARVRVESGGHSIIDDSTSPELGILLVDSYSPMERNKWETSGTSLVRVLLDDMGENVPARYDVVWNPNMFGKKSLYSSFTGLVLTGRRTVPVRGDLPKWQSTPIRRLGVMLGGGPIPRSLIRGLSIMAKRLEPMTISAAGAWAPSGWETVPAIKPWDSLATCTAMISSAGTTMWECAAVGVPAVIVLTAENQTLGADWAKRAGLNVVDALGNLDPESLADELFAAVPRAKHLPHVVSGAYYVARKLAVLATHKSSMGERPLLARSARGSEMENGD